MSDSISEVGNCVMNKSLHATGKRIEELGKVEFDYLLNIKTIVLYGLSTETERVLAEWNDIYNVIGLLDSFKTSGEQFGYPILDINDAVKIEDVTIIVVARPGSCKAIAKKIGDLCRENNVPLFDIRGKDLLAEARTVYDFSAAKGYTRHELLTAIEGVKTISFDLFDTLAIRNISSFEGVLNLVESRLRERKVSISDFVNKRIKAEKTLSFNNAPRLVEIYSELLKDTKEVNATADELANVEFEVDKSLIEARRDIVDILNQLVTQNKEVYITSDSYYSKEQILQILNKLGVESVTDVLVSCEYKTSKTGDLFKHLKTLSDGERILHIGDDISADIEAAKRHEINAFQIYSASELLELVGGLNLDKNESSLSDQIKIGMFVANLFNSPFQFENDAKRIHTESAKDVGYLFCAPMIMDFTKWFEEETAKSDNANRWLSARDGYLLKKLYEIMYPSKIAEYFYTSRIAAIRAGVESISDIEYVDGMKFSGESEENLRIRFGLSVDMLDTNDIDNDQEGLLKYSRAILDNAKSKRINYLKYINKLDIQKGSISFFDFVAKGTSQMYIQRLTKRPIMGLYFLQLEPEFMKDKNLDIKPFYSEMERERSAIFDNYYILETLLISPEPSVDEFDTDGNPVFTKETRDDKDISCFMRAQDGIIEYVKKYMSICPESERTINKKLDEILLTLVHHVEIRDKDFLGLTVEDPFFNRMTDITDVL